MNRILVTGSCGLIGSALVDRLTSLGYSVKGFDTAQHYNGGSSDITDPAAIAAALDGSIGVVHLAAVSRVNWGEEDPARCNQVNVTGTENVLAAAARMSTPPWILVASSREVYGQADVLPVPESADLHPLNHYATSKLRAEKLVNSYRENGLMAAIIRFSNVYGSVADHQDRVVPAFCRLAAAGGVLGIEGPETTLDFTHIDDVTAALEAYIEMLMGGGGPLGPLHLVSGRGTTLAELAEMAIAAAGRGAMEVKRGRSYDVKTFIGDPSRAEMLLRWRTRISIEDGMADLIERFASAAKG
jgi:UDP-glucose 4-epimerase